MKASKKNNNNNISYKNLGIQILRMILSFWIVLDHCLAKPIKNQFIFVFKNRLHVPCFILISYFFSNRTISGRNCIKIKKRFERLLIPYLILPIVIFIINRLCFLFFKITLFGSIFTLYDLIVQFIIGRKIIDVLWFQCYLIWTTLLFVIISFLAKEKYLFIFEHIYLISYILRYSNFNYDFFYKYNPLIRYSIAQFVEVMPMSVSGSVIASLNIIPIIRKNVIKSIYFCCFGLYIIFNFNIFSNVKLFGFGGIILDIGSILLFIIFFLIPFNDIKSSVFKNIIFQITNFTQGIYIFHLLIQNMLNSKFNSIKNGYFSGCIIIYIITYFISFIGEKLTKKTKLVYLFI